MMRPPKGRPGSPNRGAAWPYPKAGTTEIYGPSIDDDYITRTVIGSDRTRHPGPASSRRLARTQGPSSALLAFLQLRPWNSRAEDGIPTRDPHLGKVAGVVHVISGSPMKCKSVRPVSTQSTGSVSAVERRFTTRQWRCFDGKQV